MATTNKQVNDNYICDEISDVDVDEFTKIALIVCAKDNDVENVIRFRKELGNKIKCGECLVSCMCIKLCNDWKKAIN